MKSALSSATKNDENTQLSRSGADNGEVMTTILNIQLSLTPPAENLAELGGDPSLDGAGLEPDGAEQFMTAADEVAEPLALSFEPRADASRRFKIFAADAHQTIAPHMRGVYSSLQPDADTRARLFAAVNAVKDACVEDCLGLWEQMRKKCDPKGQFFWMRLHQHALPLLLTIKLCHQIGDVRSQQQLLKCMWGFKGWQHEFPEVAEDMRKALANLDLPLDTFVRLLVLERKVRGSDIVQPLQTGRWYQVLERMEQSGSQSLFDPRWSSDKCFERAGELTSESVRALLTLERISPPGRRVLSKEIEELDLKQFPALRAIDEMPGYPEEAKRAVTSILGNMLAGSSLYPNASPDLWPLLIKAVKVVTEVMLDKDLDIGKVHSLTDLHEIWEERKLRYFEVFSLLSSFGLFHEAYRAARKVQRAYDTQPRRIAGTIYQDWKILQRLGDAYEARAVATQRPFPNVSADGPLPKVSRWQWTMMERLGEMGSGKSKGVSLLPLSDILPLHGVKDQEEYLDSLQSIASGIMLSLESNGWKHGELPTDVQLEEITREWQYEALNDNSQYRLPLVSQSIGNGTRLLLNGHHRIAALLILVSQGFLPEEVLDRIPFEEVEIDLENLLKPAIKGHYRERNAFRFSWADAMSFDSAAVTLMNLAGVTHTLREVIDASPSLRPRRRK